jgi:subtilisin family serine protease
VAGIVSARVLGTVSRAFAPARLDPYIKLMILRVADDNGVVTLEAIMSALEYAQANGARIVSGSWTTFRSGPLREYFSRYPGLLTVVAAGNGDRQTINGQTVNIGYNVDTRETFPGSFKLPNMITVGALGPDANVSFFSNHGAGTVHILAPGVEIRSTLRTGSSTQRAYGRMSGTSQATPFTTLAAAILMAKKGLLTAQAVKQRILDTADVISGLEPPVSAGRLNLLKAISIDQDLVELTDGSYLRGTLRGPGVRFAAAPAECSGAPVLDRSGERIGRVIAQSGNMPAVALARNGRREGWVCDGSITMATRGGDVTRPLSQVRDIIWRGVRGRE